MTALSININKVALLRNSRHLSIPSVERAAVQCLMAGANGITVHPRPDARHIRAQDVGQVHAVLQDWPQAEFNIEGNPLHNLMDFVREFRPHQCTFVPDSEGQFTSDHGWSFPADLATLRPLVQLAKSLGVRVSLFMDPLPQQMAMAKSTGADRVELYTESYASAYGTPAQEQVLQGFVAAGRAALAAGLEINAGHDLNRDNLAVFLRAVAQVKEVSIGQAFIADALDMGYAAAVGVYQSAIAGAYR